MALSMGGRSNAARSYLMANTSFAQISVVRQQEAAFRKKEEDGRQADEKGSLGKAYKIEKGRFETEWAAFLGAAVCTQPLATATHSALATASD